MRLHSPGWSGPGLILALLGGAALAASPPASRVDATAPDGTGPLPDATFWPYHDPDGATGDRVGEAVDISGDVAVIGAPGRSRPGCGTCGVATVYTRIDGTWRPTAQLFAPDGASLD